MEDDGVIDTVQELWPEMCFEGIIDRFLHTLVAHGFIVLRESDVGPAKVSRSKVGGHDQYRVSEVDRASLGIS